MQSVIVTRGVIDVPDANPATIAEQRLINQLGQGHGGRTFKHRRLFHVGERLSLPDGEAARLAALGIVDLVST
jgi:hypothetical protein